MGKGGAMRYDVEMGCNNTTVIGNFRQLLLFFGQGANSLQVSGATN